MEQDLARRLASSDGAPEGNKISIGQQFTLPVGLSAGPGTSPGESEWDLGLEFPIQRIHITHVNLIGKPAIPGRRGRLF